jgi:hypothetical protein
MLHTLQDDPAGQNENFKIQSGKLLIAEKHAAPGPCKKQVYRP